MTEGTDVAAHYTNGGLLARIEAGLTALGAGRPLELETLAQVDEFHIGGRQATVPFLERLGLDAGQRVLDMGCGIGGPARFAAQSSGASVVGVDLTGEFVETGQALTGMAGLSEQVEMIEGSILDLPFGAAGFDAAYMIHVGMNITDKHRLAAEAARVLKPGAPFGIYDVMQMGTEEIAFPVPWAATPRESALATPQRYRDALEAAGFEVVSETDRTGFARDFFAQLAASQAAADGPPPLGLHLVMGADTGVKIKNMVANITAGRIAPVEMIARLPG